MTMHPQSPQANAPCTLTTEPTVPNEAAVTTEPPVPNTEMVIREQDSLMPIANVVRIMRRVLPPHAKISDDAKEVIQECVSEFISFVTGEANERCHTERRKTVTAEDIVWAMERLGFDDYVAPLGGYLQRMRDCEGTGRGSGRGDRAQTRAPCAPSVAMAALHGGQMHPAVYPLPYSTPMQAYAAVPMVPANLRPHFGGQYQMLGGEHSIPAYFGGAAFQAGGSQGRFCADEASSSNEEPPAAVGTGSE
ncbi:nuclear transcription factor Y subunit B-8-like [Phragmites australis]|uniref:nuclear transcription factor Y subunit B-8-like n=1 Tax=Phragmites australis TaxID=29695 RepID=UPI002D77C6D5|nr:nuclear transcription factor Y subunit B-8-like [Phragmites australis]